MRNLKRVRELEKKYNVKIQQPFGWGGNYCIYHGSPSPDTLILDTPVLNAEAEDDIKEALARR